MLMNQDVLIVLPAQGLQITARSPSHLLKHGLYQIYTRPLSHFNKHGPHQTLHVTFATLQ